MSHPTILGLDGAVVGDPMPAGLRRWLATVILLLMGLLGAVLLWRRAAGALAQPLPGETLALLGVLLAGAAIAARWLWRQTPGRRPANCRLDRFVLWCPVFLLLTIAAAVHIEGTSPVGIVLFWSAVVFEEGAAGLGTIRRRKHRGDVPAAHDGRAEPVVSEIIPAEMPPFETFAGDRVQPADSAHEESLGQPAPGDQVTQQFVRSHSAEGADVFSGWLRVELPPGGRTASVHVAFCPPFARTPAIEVHQEDGPLGRIKTAQALPYGARLDFKLSRSCEQTATVLLRFVATLTEK